MCSKPTLPLSCEAVRSALHDVSDISSTVVAVEPGDENVASSDAEPPEQLLSECNEADLVIAFDTDAFAVASVATAVESVDVDFSRAFTTDLTVDFAAAFVAAHFLPVSAVVAALTDLYCAPLTVLADFVDVVFVVVFEAFEHVDDAELAEDVQDFDEFDDDDDDDDEEEEEEEDELLLLPLLPLLLLLMLLL